MAGLLVGYSLELAAGDLDHLCHNYDRYEAVVDKEFHYLWWYVDLLICAKIGKFNSRYVVVVCPGPEYPTGTEQLEEFWILRDVEARFLWKIQS